MNFKSSPKIFENYKSEYPQKTISKIEKYLESVNLKLRYQERKINHKEHSIYWGVLIYERNDSEIVACSGKGISSELCKAATYSELIERILSKHSSISSFLKIKTNKLKKTKGKRISIKEFFKNFSTSSNIEKNKFNDWVDAFSLTDNKNIGIPYSFVTSINRSNGLAAGNTLEEAVSQAFCEICERYSLAEHLIKKISAPTIDKKTIKNKKIIYFIKLFESLNFKVEIKDFTLGNKFPVMGVLFINKNLKNEKKLIKSVYYKTLCVGSHFDSEEAIVRCFTENIQLYSAIKERLIKPGRLILKSNNFLYTINFLNKYFTEKENLKIIKDFEKTKYYVPMAMAGKTFDNFDFLNKTKKITLSKIKSVKTNDFIKDIGLIKEIALKNKWQVLIINHSIKESPVKVIRMIIPSVSDMLRFKYKKIKKIKKLHASIINKIPGNSNPVQKFKYLKFVVLPENVIPYPSALGIQIFNHKKIIEEMITLSEIINNKREVKKIKRIISKELNSNNKMIV